MTIDLRYHGDGELEEELLDCAVNVRMAGPPDWLRDRLAASLDQLGSYPDIRVARIAAAARHRRDPEQALLTAGAAEAFVLLARVLRPRYAVVVHPSFTEPEAALRAAGHRVERVVTTPPFLLPPVPEDADLVVLGNPTNPTSVLHPGRALAALARPGRTLVVDEAFADCVPHEAESLAGRADLPGLVVVRSLTKTWGLAGLRVGYLLAPADLVEALAAAQSLWSVSTPAAVAVEACSTPAAVAEAATWARELADERARYAGVLATLPDAYVVPDPRASFLLLRLPAGARVRRRLRERGIALRRGETFPGLGPDWLRVAVRDRVTNDRVATTLAEETTC